MKTPLAVLGLGTKLWLGLGGLLFILLLGSAISAGVLTHFSHELQRLLRENYDSEIFCNQMIDALDRLDASARQLAWDEGGDPVDADAQIARFEHNLARQLTNVSLPGELEESQHLASLWRAYRKQYDGLAVASPEQRRQLYRAALLPLFRDSRGSAQHIAALNMQNMVAADGRVRTTMLQVRNVLLLLVGIGTLLAAVVLGAAGATVLKPLRELTRSASRLGAGELDLTVTVRSKDEIGQLADAFNAMAGHLREYRQIDAERLLRAQTTTQLAIDSLPDAVLVASPDGVVEIANRTARTYFRAEPGRNVSHLGFDWLSVLHADALGGKAAEPPGYSSTIQLFQNGEERFLLPHGVPMWDAGRVVGVAIILVDVTRLRQADEFKSDLVSTVSHELRTPLTSIRMSALLLSDETLGPLSARQRKLVDAARDESERLYRIIENLLDFSRSQAGPGKLKSRALPISELINDVLPPLQTGFDEKQIRLTSNIASAPNAFADPALAASVLTNLLTNALKFTPAGGQVEITAEPAGDFVAIAVSDTGPGVPPEHVGRLFQRFFRVPGAAAAHGTGLGLAIARQIVTAHGGRLTYTPEANGGSVFRFTLPTVK